MEITGQDILLIKKTNTVRTYKSETEGYAGKNYRLYAYNSKAFAVHEDDDFIVDLEISMSRLAISLLVFSIPEPIL